MTAFLDVIRRFWHPIAATFLGRGEVADAPRLTGCRINETPHECRDEGVVYGPLSSDDEVIAALEKHFPKTKTRRNR